MIITSVAKWTVLRTYNDFMYSAKYCTLTIKVLSDGKDDIVFKFKDAKKPADSSEDE